MGIIQRITQGRDHLALLIQIITKDNAVPAVVMRQAHGYRTLSSPFARKFNECSCRVAAFHFLHLVVSLSKAIMALQAGNFILRQFPYAHRNVVALHIIAVAAHLGHAEIPGKI